MGNRIVLEHEVQVRRHLEGKFFLVEDMGPDNPYQTSLSRAEKYAGKEGFILSLPELIRARLSNPTNNQLWQFSKGTPGFFSTLSEENRGKTIQGNNLLVVLHGGGFFGSSERVKSHLKRHGAILEKVPDSDDEKFNYELFNPPFITREEFLEVLEGRLPDGLSVPVWPYREFSGMQQLPRRYGVILDFASVQQLDSEPKSVDSLIDNPLFVARVGGLQQAAAYLEKFKQINGQKPIHNNHEFIGDNLDIERYHLRCLYLAGFTSLDSAKTEGEMITSHDPTDDTISANFIAVSGRDIEEDRRTLELFERNKF